MSAIPAPFPTPILRLPRSRRWLLACRFDYRQRTWNLPLARPLPEAESAEPIGEPDASALLAALSAATTQFADPVPGRLPQNRSFAREPDSNPVLAPNQPQIKSK